MSIDITLSREEIRKNLLSYYAQLLEIEESQLDLSDTSFSSFVINSLSALASDVLVYGSIIYNESSLVTAQLPETILRWASYLDYYPKQATSAHVDILIKIPLIGNFYTEIQPTHKFYANDITFIPKYKYTIDTRDGISVNQIKDDIAYPLPYTFEVKETDEGTVNYLVFTIPVYQEEIIEEEFTIPQLSQFEFYTKTIDIEDYVLNVQVFIDDEEWKPGRLVLSEPGEKVFEWIVIGNKLKISFGNNLFGLQPSNKIAKVIITTTKGSAGNVGIGTITKGDSLYTNDNPPNRVDYEVINVVSATGGQDIEQLTDIKRNAPRSLSILHRIVSQTDYENIFKILYGENVHVIPIVKRSDVGINDILIYSTLHFNDDIVPTTSVHICCPTDTTIDMLSTITSDGYEWIVPFHIDIDYENRLAYYKFIPPKQTLVISATFRSDTSNSLVSTGYVEYNYDTKVYTVKLYVISTVTPTQKIEIRYPDRFVEKLPDRVESVTTHLYVFEYDIPRSDLLGFLSFDIYTYEDTTLVELDSTTFQEIELSQTISHIVNISGNDYIIDIPVILKSWWDENVTSDEIRNTFLQEIVSKFIFIQDNLENRMMNTNITIKFLRTFGPLKNLQYSKEDYIVEKIVHSSSEITSPITGKMYAISDPIDRSDPWYQYAGYIAIWGGTDWNFFKPGEGTLILNKEDGLKYATDGRRWLVPDYNNPLDIDIEVFVISGGETLYNEILDIIIDYINNEVGPQQSIYLSKIIDKLHNLPEVKFVRLVKPETDIIYRKPYNLTKEELMLFVPEYISTNKDHIRLTIKYAK